MITPEQLEHWLNLASNVVALAAVIAALTPSPVDDGIVAALRKLVDLLAFNWGHAANQARVEDKQDVATPRPDAPAPVLAPKAKSKAKSKAKPKSQAKQ